MSEELRTLYDITNEEDRNELAEFMKKGVKLDTTFLIPEDLSEVIESFKDLINKLGAELIEIDHKNWPKMLIVKYRFQGQEKELKLKKVEEGAYKPVE